MNITKKEKNGVQVLAAAVIAMSLVSAPALAKSKKSNNWKLGKSASHQLQTSKRAQKQRRSHTERKLGSKRQSAVNRNGKKWRMSGKNSKTLAGFNSRRLQTASKLQRRKNRLQIDRNQKKLRELNRVGEGIKQLEQLKQISKSPLERARKVQDSSGLRTVEQRPDGDLESLGKLVGQDSSNGRTAGQLNGGATDLTRSGRSGRGEGGGIGRFSSVRGNKIRNRVIKGNGNKNRIGTVSSNVLGSNLGFGKSRQREAPQNPSSIVADPRAKAGDGWKYVGYDRDENTTFSERPGTKGRKEHRAISHDGDGNTTVRRWTTDKHGNVRNPTETVMLSPDENGDREWMQSEMTDNGINVTDRGHIHDQNGDDRPDTPDGENPDPVRGGGIQLNECLFKDCAVVMGMNRKKRVNSIDMTSQPGRGEQRQSALRRGAAPRIGVEAVINGGDGSFGSSRSGGGYKGDPDPCDTAQGGPGCGNPTGPVSHRR